ncbi:MAG: hypothetical protein IT249_18855 [Chitinophagaceae bacterium]|nr:hypothetical protein [Chitinophagaceae bacterium]
MNASQLFFQWVMGSGKSSRTFDEKSVMGEQMLEAKEVNAGIDKAIQTYKEGSGYTANFARNLKEENPFLYGASFVNDLDNNSARAFHGGYTGSATVTKKEETTFGVYYYINIRITDFMTVTSGLRPPPFLGGYDKNGGKFAVYDGHNPYGPNGQFRTININYDMNIKVFRFNSAAKNTIKLFYYIFN